MTVLLRERELLWSAQLILATMAGSAALVPSAMVLGQRHPDIGQTIVECFGCALTVLMAVTWLGRWPGRRQSRAAGSQV